MPYLQEYSLHNVIVSLDTKPTSCHAASHVVGVAATRLLRDPPFPSTTTVSDEAAALIVTCGTLCGAGCFHGIVEGLLLTYDGIVVHMAVNEVNALQRLNGTQLAAFDTPIEAICRVASTIFSITECAHAVGHIYTMLSMTSDDALIACWRMGNRHKQFYCAGGVYMQHLLSATNYQAGPTTQWQPCLESVIPAACFQYAWRFARDCPASVCLTPNGHYSRSSYLCITLAQPHQRYGCLYGLGALLGATNTQRVSLTMRLDPHAFVEWFDAVRRLTHDPVAVYAAVDGWMFRSSKYYPTAVAPLCAALPSRSWTLLCRAIASAQMYSDRKNIDIYFKPGM